MNSENKVRLQAESVAPLAAGLALALIGGLAALDRYQAGLLPAGPLKDASLAVALIVAGAGGCMLLASWDLLRLGRSERQARAEAAQALRERDQALVQARRMRALTDGLSLMREIHRSTAIPDRQDRLQRILTLVADLFDAREVTLFGVAVVEPLALRPVAYQSNCTSEEIFLAFEDDSFGTDGQRVAPGAGIKAQDAAMACEGNWLHCEGRLSAGGSPVARVKWRQSLSSQDGAPPRQQACAMLEELFQRLDFDPASARDARQALEQRRTLRKNVLDDLHGTLEESLLLCVPLMADQRLIGVLRIRRQPEGFDGPVAETLEETLIESAKHIALAMKKDEDDRKAITDQLTGLFIKRHFLSMLEQSRLQAAEDPGKGFSLILSDIDHFKKVNDTHGHLSGDLILKQVARVLRAGLRAGDLAFRYGGEEMAILMPEAGVEAAQQTAERLRAAVEGAVLLGDRDQKIPTTLSMGVASFVPGLSEQTLIARADQALYASKHAGRNRVTSWSEELEAPRPVPALSLPESILSK